MTKFGKIMVFVNLVFSLSLMIWALILWLTRIDWSNNEAKTGRPQAGELVARNKEVIAAWAPMTPAETSWRTERDYVQKLEEQRRDTRRWYDYQLALLEKAPSFVYEVVPTKENLPDYLLDPDPKTPQFKNAIPVKMKETGLRASNFYDLRKTELLLGSDMKPGLFAERTRLRKGIEQDVEEITKMLGPKGLHERGIKERAKREGVVEEQKNVERPLINTAAESQFSIEREKELRARVVELEERRQELMKALSLDDGGKK